MRTKPSPVPAVPVERPSEAANLVTSLRWGWYGLSLLVPFAGIFIGLFLYDQDSREVRKVGRNSLFIGFLVWVVFPVLVFAALFLVGTLAIFSWISQALPVAD